MAHHVHSFNYWWVEHMPAIWWGFFKILFVICNFLCLKPWLSVEIYFGQLIPGRIKIDNLQCALWQSKELVDDHKNHNSLRPSSWLFFNLFWLGQAVVFWKSLRVFHNAWYSMLLDGIAWYCMILYGIVIHGIVWYLHGTYCMVLNGIAWYFVVLHVIACYCVV